MTGKFLAQKASNAEKASIRWRHHGYDYMIQLAAAASCFPAIHAIFRNGVAYKFVKGRNLLVGDIVNPEKIR